MSLPDPLVSPREITSSGLCIGCGSCVAQTPGTSMRWDRYGQRKPEGPEAWQRARTADFSATCPFSPAAANETQIAEKLFPSAPHADPLIGRYQGAYVGHAAEEGFRPDGSSGGMVTWVAAELMRLGLVDGVAHVAATGDPQAEDGFFHYRLSRSLDEVRSGAKSRYYPIDLSAVLRAIRAAPGRYAVIGVPCFIKAINLLRAHDPVLKERIAYTLGLYCGHMKSARLVESFAWQMQSEIGNVRAVEYRLKDESRPANWYTAYLAYRDGSSDRKDWWHLVDGDWGSGFFQNSACNYCDDVVAETADISFGDAWVEPYSSDGRGTNVVLVRSSELHGIVERGIAEGRLSLTPVDRDFVVETQAAGFRQRREGLAYRLSWTRFGVQPRKRVAPDASGLPFRRKLIYRMRYQISAWSHRVFQAARRLRWPGLYIGWGRLALAAYHGLAYSRGRFGALVDRLEKLASRA